MTMYSKKEMTKNPKLDFFADLTGELAGTFILVFFGCSSVAVTVLFSAHIGLFQVAAVWGMGVALAIYATRHITCAHLNPAVSVAMVVARRMSYRKLPAYLSGQFLGAFLAATVIYLLFSDSIINFELIHDIQRGSSESVATAMIFGEFYPNPGNSEIARVSMLNGFLAETFGTFALTFFIFSLTEGCNVGRPDDSLGPLFIGCAVALIISVIAPLTQAGLNPARDLAPRIFAYLAGWQQAALPDKHYGFLIVYVFGPLLGGMLAAVIFRKIIEPIMLRKNEDPGCNCL